MERPQEPIVVLLTGGINSTVAAATVLERSTPHFLYVDHGHPAAESELETVRRISHALAADLHLAKLPGAADLAAVDINGEIAVGPSKASAAAWTSDRHPSGLFLSILGIAVQLARQINASQIICGVSQMTNASESGFQLEHCDPQTRSTFFHAASAAIELSLSRKCLVELVTPFVDFRREDIIQAGLRLGAPFHLTWSCHQSGSSPCHQCPGCTSRRTAFAATGIDDPARSKPSVASGVSLR